jgi:copper oxidase (laccase) domain-containing protein
MMEVLEVQRQSTKFFILSFVTDCCWVVIMQYTEAQWLALAHAGFSTLLPDVFDLGMTVVMKTVFSNLAFLWA